MRKVETATAMNLLMQGMAFMEIGQEFGRTKLVATGENGELTHDDRERAMNSYNAPDSVNQVNWNLINERQDSIEFIRQVIRLKTKLVPFLTLAMMKFTIMSLCILRLNIAATLSMKFTAKNTSWWL